MDIIGKVRKETLSVKIEGRIDAETSPELEEYLAGNTQGIKVIEFELKKLDYISSSGLRVFLRLKRSQDKDGYIVLKNMNETVRAVFDVTGFSDMFIIK
ncbi:MAG: STAS domain-containing protein [Ruminiclostridium sp.]|nr:STAS domain-containing protein [Ruminiclostridium sp.]